MLPCNKAGISNFHLEFQISLKRYSSFSSYPVIMIFFLPEKLDIQCHPVTKPEFQISAENSRFEFLPEIPGIHFCSKLLLLLQFSCEHLYINSGNLRVCLYFFLKTMRRISLKVRNSPVLALCLGCFGTYFAPSPEATTESSSLRVGHTVQNILFIHRYLYAIEQYLLSAMVFAFFPRVISSTDHRHCHCFKPTHVHVFLKRARVTFCVYRSIMRQSKT